MPSPKQIFGRLAEDRAALLLYHKNMEIIARHVTTRYGEIDILARDGDTVVAVEVKARRNDKFGRAIEAVTDKKLKKITMALNEIMIARDITNQPTRIDVITVEPDGMKYWADCSPVEE